MVDNKCSLERQIANLPLPEATACLDRRVALAIESIGSAFPSRSRRPEQHRHNQIQWILAASLCGICFACGFALGSRKSALRNEYRGDLTEIPSYIVASSDDLDPNQTAMQHDAHIYSTRLVKERYRENVFGVWIAE